MFGMILFPSVGWAWWTAQWVQYWGGLSQTLGIVWASVNLVFEQPSEPWHWNRMTSSSCPWESNSGTKTNHMRAGNHVINQNRPRGPVLQEVLSSSHMKGTIATYSLSSLTIMMSTLRLLRQSAHAWNRYVLCDSSVWCVSPKENEVTCRTTHLDLSWTGSSGRADNQNIHWCVPDRNRPPQTSAPTGVPLLETDPSARRTQGGCFSKQNPTSGPKSVRTKPNPTWHSGQIPTQNQTSGKFLVLARKKNTLSRNTSYNLGKILCLSRTQRWVVSLQQSLA